jgi:hypothetical protein
VPSSQFDTQPFPDLPLQAPPVMSLSLSATAMVPGDTAALTVSGAQAGDTVYFGLSTRGFGEGLCTVPTLDLCLDLADPITLLGTAQAGANGEATWDIPSVPQAALGTEVFFQAVVWRGVGGRDSLISPPVRRVLTTTPVPIRSASTGDLLLTEVMANPDAVSDADGEWIEIHNPMTTPFELEGMYVTDGRGGGFVVDAPMPIEPGGYLVFASELDPDVNGGVYAAGELTFAITNSESPLELWENDRTWSSTLLDGIHYDAADWPLQPGRSMNLAARSFNGTSNDMHQAWCEATTPYGDGDLGTPGGPNVDCAGITGPITLLTVDDLAPGDLVITEIMANGAACSDAFTDYIEFVNTTDSYVDLFGVAIEKVANSSFIGEHTLPPQGIAVAYKDVSNQCYGLDAGAGEADVYFAYNSSLILLNTGDDIRLTDYYGGTVFDQVDTRQFATPSHPGAAWSLDVDRFPTAADAVSNDQQSAWCRSPDVLPGSTDSGSPGFVVNACTAGTSGGTPPPGLCAEDGYEPNDTRATATPATERTYSDLTICSVIDNDTFRIEVDPGATLSADVSFDPSTGDPITDIRDGNGAILATNYGDAPTSPGVYELDWTNSGSTPVDVYVEVWNTLAWGGLEYDLTLDFGSSAGCAPDRYEPNESRNDAANISPRTITGVNLCGVGENDWYEGYATYAQTVEAIVRYDPAEGDLRMWIEGSNTGGRDYGFPDAPGVLRATFIAPWAGAVWVNVEFQGDAGAPGLDYTLEYDVRF